WFCESDRDRKIRNDTVAIGFTRITVETGRKINCEHVSALACPQPIYGTTGCTDGIAQRRFRANPEQAVENYQRSRSADVCLGRDCFLRSPQLVSGFLEKFHQNNARISFAAARWCHTQNFRPSPAQAFKFLAHQSAAIGFPKSKPHFNFPSEAPQTFRSDQGVAAIVAFPCEDNALARPAEKSGDRLSNAGACFVHQRFNFYAARERGFFRGSHLRRSQDRQVQLSLLIFWGGFCLRVGFGRLFLPPRTLLM